MFTVFIIIIVIIILLLLFFFFAGTYFSGSLEKSQTLEPIKIVGPLGSLIMLLPDLTVKRNII